MRWGTRVHVFELEPVFDEPGDLSRELVGAAIKKRCVFAICTHNVRFEWELNALLKAAYTLSSSIAPACGLIIHVFHVGASSIIVKCVLLLAVVRLAVVISPLPLFAGLAGRRVGFV